MSKPSKIISTKLVTTVTKGTRTVQVGFVDRTDTWTRLDLNKDVQEQFKKTTEEYIDTLRPDTEAVVLQETPHESPKDQRTHFTAVEPNSEGKETVRRHFKPHE